MQKKKDKVTDLIDKISNKGLMTDELVIRFFLLFRSISNSKPKLP